MEMILVFKVNKLMMVDELDGIRLVLHYRSLKPCCTVPGSAVCNVFSFVLSCLFCFFLELNSLYIHNNYYPKYLHERLLQL